MYKAIFPKNVNIVSTSRYIDGGNSADNYSNFNLGIHSGDDKDSVLLNRDLLIDNYKLPSQPRWLKQTHSNICLDASQVHNNENADASFTLTKGVVCAILTADCLPIFACNRKGTMVGIAHAGWRGIVGGVVESFVECFEDKDLLFYFGAAISAKVFEVGDDVYKQFINKNNSLKYSFTKHQDKYLLDIFGATKTILNEIGMHDIAGGDQCTYLQKDKYFSYRRDGKHSGRMAHLIWMSN
jgi:hypothetical protein